MGDVFHDFGNVSFLIEKIRLWSDIARWTTPDWDIFSGLLVEIKSIKEADVGVTLVGSLISWSNW
jgi:hypothetical protein